MKKHLTLSNLLFAITIFLLLYKPSRIWFIRQISFSPSIEKVETSARVFDYNWKLNGLNTDDINFDEFKGKVVFLNFWATWCPPCVAELPSIQVFYSKYKDKVAFVFITDENAEDVLAFFKRKGYEFPVYKTNGNYLNELPLITSIPRTFVFDKLGNIRVDKSGAADWNTTSFITSIDQMLDEE